MKLKLRLLCIMLGSVACGHLNAPGPKSHSDTPKAAVQDESRFQKIADIPDGKGWRSINFMNDREGWLGSPEKLWRTTNGGSDWALVYSADSYEQQIRTIEFIDTRVGFMQRFGGLYQTEDGGRTWTKGPRTPFDDGKGDLRVLRFRPDGRTGWAAGGIFRPITQKELKGGVPNNTFNSITNEVLDGAIFRTDDGGLTWKRQPVLFRAGRFLDLFFMNEMWVLALGDGGVFYTENGREWRQIEFKPVCVDRRYLEEYEGRPLNVAFVDAKVGWISFDDGRMVKSTDGGRSWCDLVHPGDIEFALPFDRYLGEIHFSDPAHGWGLGGDGFLYETQDGGAKWRRVSDIKFDDMHFINHMRGWLVGREGLFTMKNS